MSLAKKHLQPSITEGKMLGSMIRYSIPIMLANVLQLLYNSADMFVLGNFCSDPNAIGAVGCTSALINLVLGLFIGLGAGVCVTVAQSLGAGDNDRVSRAVHSSVLLAILLGVVVTVIGVVMSPVFLGWMRTDAVFFEGAALYMRIYFLGSVGNLLFNFLAGILRSKGDTVHPLIFSSLGGVVNILLNLLFVIAFDLGIAGVAIATIIAQALSALLSLIFLMRLDGPCRICIRRIRLDGAVVGQFIRYGLPAGIQGSFFSLSNVILQGSYNLLGPLYVNANAAASQIDAYVFTAMNAFYHVALTYGSQNFGAKQYDRVKRAFGGALLCVSVVGLTLGILSFVFARPLVSIFNDDPAVIEVARVRLLYVGAPYFLCGIMEVANGTMRSIGASLAAMIITFIGSCLLRIIWVFTVFRALMTIEVLYWIYPLSWIATFIALTLVFFLLLSRHIRRERAQAASLLPQE